MNYVELEAEWTRLTEVAAKLKNSEEYYDAWRAVLAARSEIETLMLDIEDRVEIENDWIESI